MFVRKDALRLFQFSSRLTRLQHVLFGYDYFLAHRSSDGKAYASKLYDALSTGDAGLDCFLDVKHYGAGENLSLMQELALLHTTRLVVIVTPDALCTRDGMDHLLNEIHSFQELHPKGRIVPIGAQESLPAEGSESPRLLQLIPNFQDNIWILENLDFQSGDPSPAAIAKLRNDFSEERRSTIRFRWLRRTAYLLLLLLIVSAALGVTSEYLRRRGSERLADRNWEIARRARGKPHSDTHVSPVLATWRLIEAAKAYSASGDEESAEQSLYAARFTGGHLRYSFPHDLTVSGASLHPDGEHVLTWSFDGTARQWSTKSGEAIGAPMRGAEPFRGASYSLDGSKILTWGGKRTVQQWSAADSKSLGDPLALSRPEGDILLAGAIYNPTGTVIFTWPQQSGPGQLWDAVTGERIGAPVETPAAIVGAQFTSNGEVLVVWTLKYAVHLRDARLGTAVGQAMQHTSYIREVVFSPDRRWILTCSKDKSVRIWQAEDGAPHGAAMLHEGEVYSACFSSNGKRILSCSKDGKAVIWDFDSRERVASLSHTGQVIGACYSPNGRRILTWTSNGMVHQWDATAGASWGTAMHYGDELDGAFYSPDGRSILVWSRPGAARLYDADSNKVWGEPLRRDGEVLGALWSRDSRYVLTWGSDAAAAWWRTAGGNPIGRSPRLDNLGGVAVHPGGRIYAAWSASGPVVLGNAVTAQPIAKFEHQGRLSGVAFSPDGNYLLSWGSEAWQLRNHGTNAPMITHRINAGPYGGASFSPGGDLIVTWRKGVIEAYRTSAPQQPVAQMEHPEEVRDVRFSPNGQRIVSLRVFGAAQVWNPDSGEKCGPPLSLDRAIQGITWHPNSVDLVGWSDNGGVQLWNSVTGEKRLLHQFLGMVWGAVFSPDGSRLIAFNQQGEVRQWTVQSGKPQGAAMRLLTPVTRATYSPDGEYIVGWAQDGMMQKWRASDGLPVGDMLSVGGTVRSVDFFGQGRLATTTLDGEVRIWQASNLNLLATFAHGDRLVHASLLRERNRLVTAGADNQVKIWHLESGEPRTVDEFAAEFTAASQLVPADQGKLRPAREKRAPTAK